MTIKLNGSVGGSVSIDAPPSTTSQYDISFKLPVADGSAGQVLTTDGSGNLSWVTPATTNGITMADQWRLNTTVNLSSGSGDLTSNWERNDNASFSGIGSAMTESSGLFSFPVTGIYLIMVDIVFVSSGAQYQGFSIRATQDNGSSFSNIAQSYGGSKSNSGSEYDSVCAQVIFDVTNTSNDKFKLQYEVNTSVSIDGNSNTQRSGFTVIRLGDT